MPYLVLNPDPKAPSILAARSLPAAATWPSWAEVSESQHTVLIRPKEKDSPRVGDWWGLSPAKLLVLTSSSCKPKPSTSDAKAYARSRHMQESPFHKMTAALLSRDLYACHPLYKEFTPNPVPVVETPSSQGIAYRWACGETLANIMQESPFQDHLKL